MNSKILFHNQQIIHCFKFELPSPMYENLCCLVFRNEAKVLNEYNFLIGLSIKMNLRLGKYYENRITLNRCTNKFISYNIA